MNLGSSCRFNAETNHFRDSLVVEYSDAAKGSPRLLSRTTDKAVGEAAVRAAVLQLEILRSLISMSREVWLGRSTAFVERGGGLRCPSTE